MTRNLPPRLHLNKIIQENEESLRRYQAKSNANSNFIRRKQVEIAELKVISNQLKDDSLIPLFADINSGIMECVTNPDLHGVHIYLMWGHDTSHVALIQDFKPDLKFFARGT